MSEKRLSPGPWKLDGKSVWGPWSPEEQRLADEKLVAPMRLIAHVWDEADGAAVVAVPEMLELLKFWATQELPGGPTAALLARIGVPTIK